MSGVVAVSGCGRVLGVEKDYVLREPITVRFADGAEPVTIPAGARVKQRWFKDDVAAVEIYGSASRTQLNRSGELQ
jgi:hypothetical protein